MNLTNASAKETSVKPQEDTCSFWFDPTVCGLSSIYSLLRDARPHAHFHCTHLHRHF